MAISCPRWAQLLVKEVAGREGGEKEKDRRKEDVSGKPRSSSAPIAPPHPPRRLQVQGCSEGSELIKAPMRSWVKLYL